MNPLKSTTIACFIILSFLILIIIAHQFTKKFKSRINADGKLKISFALWYSAIFLAGSVIISILTPAVVEVIDNLIKIHPPKFYLELVKAVSLVVGVGFLWFALWLLATKFLVKLVLSKTDEKEEMEDDHWSYFLVKAVMLMALVFSLSELLTIILRSLIPNLEVPFFH